MRVVVCAMAKNEHLYINDWVKHYISIGFDTIYIYDNDDVDKPSITNYIDQKYLPKVKIIDIRGQSGKCLQHDIYTKFYYDYNFDWVFYCDVDEYLMGIKNIKLLLEQWYLRNVKQIRVKWKLFGDDDKIERDMSLPVWECFTKEITSSLNRNLIDKGTLENQGKAFVRGGLKNVVVRSPHFASYYRRENVIPSVLPSGAPCYSKIVIKENYKRENIYLHHYMTKSLSEFINQKLNRNDAIFNQKLTMDYYWRINKKTPKKLEWLKEKGLI